MSAVEKIGRPVIGHRHPVRQYWNIPTPTSTWAAMTAAS